MKKIDPNAQSDDTLESRTMAPIQNCGIGRFLFAVVSSFVNENKFPLKIYTLANADPDRGSSDFYLQLGFQRVNQECCGKISDLPLSIQKGIENGCVSWLGGHDTKASREETLMLYMISWKVEYLVNESCDLYSASGIQDFD